MSSTKDSIIEEWIGVGVFAFFLIADTFFLKYYLVVRGLLFCYALFLIRTTSRANEYIYPFKKYLACYLLFFIIAFLHLLYICFSHESFITPILLPRGISVLAQNIITLFFVYAYLKKYENRAIQIAVYAFIIAYIICITKGLVYLGPWGVLEYTFNFSEDKIYASNVELNRMFEIHSLGLSMPIFILVYWIIRKECHVKIFSKPIYWLLIIFSLLAFKRISLIALILSLLLFYILRHLRHKKNVVDLYIPIGIVVMNVIVLLCVYNPLFYDFATEQGQLFMGRQYIYKGITEDTDLSWSFLGKGWGWVNTYMEYRNKIDKAFWGIRGAHNDILRMYIEGGSFVFAVYQCIYYFIVPQKLKRINRNFVFYYLVVQIFAWITYLTDNTAQYWDFQTLILISPFIICYQQSNRTYKKKAIV